MRSVRSYLLALVAVCIILATVAFGIIVNGANQSNRRQAEAQAIETAQVLSQGVDRELDRAIGVLTALANSGAASRRDWSALDRQARAAVTSRDAWIVVQDRSGQQVLNTRVQAGAALQAARPPAEMWRELAKGGPRICDLSRGLVEPNIVCVDLGMGGNNPEYAISLVFRPHFFDAIVRRAEEGRGKIATLVDRRHRIIWRNHAADELVGRTATGEMLAALRSRAGSGVLESTSLENVRMLSGFHRSPLSGWVVIVGTPLEQVSGAISATYWRGVAMFLAVLVLGCVVAIYIARRLAGAMSQLARVHEAGSATRRTGILEIDRAAAALEEAAAARSESEQRFREVADAAPVLIWVADTQNKGVWYNKAWLDFTGRSLDEEIGDGWIEGVHPDDRAHCAEICGGSFDRREPFKLDFRLRRHDGEWRTVEDIGVPRMSDSGEFLGYIGTCIDVTDTRAAEAQIRASEARYRRIFEQTSDLILTADLNQVLTDANPAAAEAVGVPQSEILGMRIADFVSPEDYEQTTAMLRRKLEEGGTTRYDVRVRSRRGEWLYWEINSGLTYDDNGVPVGLHVVGRDVTERKRAERQTEILVGELNHRVKNTLAVVQSLAHQTFRDGVEVKEAKAAFEGRLQAMAAAHNLLTRQLWAFASMRELVELSLAPFCSPGRCTIDGLDFKLAPQAAVSISLAIHELATNAVKYGALSGAHGHVTVSWTREAGKFRFEWRERDGPAVTPPKKQGFGMRLIQRSLAAELGGKVEVDFDANGLVCRIDSDDARLARLEPTL